MHSNQDSTIFIDGLGSAIRTAFKTFDEYADIIKKQAESLKIFKDQKERESFDFKDWGQWQDSANHYFAQMIHRHKGIDAIALDVSRKFEEMKIQMDLTEQCLGIMAGTILQIGKQAIAYRWEYYKKITISQRQVGRTNIGEIIWEGRNHALHWDEGNPHHGVNELFIKIKSDFPTRGFDPNINCSNKIMGILGWESADAVIADLKALNK